MEMEILSAILMDNQPIVMPVNDDNYLGCTANVVVIDDTHYYCANAGDSRSVLCRGNGKIISLSEDHKP